MPLQFQSLTTVPLSNKERISQIITPENVGIALSALQRDGIVCLSNAVDVTHIETLNTILSNEAEIMAKLPTTHFNDVCSSLYEPSSINADDGRTPPPAAQQEICPKGPLSSQTSCTAISGPMDPPRQ
jgi:hypothetical protein